MARKKINDVPQILSRRQVAAKIGVSLTTLWRLVTKGLFPRPLQISPGRVGWTADIVDRWIDERGNA